MNFKNLLLAGCALAMCAAAATAQVPSYIPADGLVGWWPFNGNANDESGNGNNGVVIGSSLTGDRFGNNDEAYYFDGITNRIRFNLNSIDNTLPAASESTTSIWIKTPDLNGPIVSMYGNNSDYDFHLGTLADIVQSPGNYGILVRTECCGTGNNIFGGNVSDDVWHMLTIVRLADGTIKLFKDGNLDATSGSGQNGILTFNPIYMAFGADEFWIDAGANGCNSCNSEDQRYLHGLLDDIAIYNRALTPEEIQNLYIGSSTTVDTGNGAAPLPQGIPYQAAARDAQGQSLVNAAVNVRFTLHEGAADGAASYAETHALTTNIVGLFNAVFGNGTPEQSAFDSINWAATTKFLQVEIDLGEGYVDMGTTQLLSVPYALRSDEAARVKNAGLPIYSNNAAALAGGLVAGEMYRTAAGVLMVAY
jgi:Concanavalin A-like lectin/glucanases superfamily